MVLWPIIALGVLAISQLTLLIVMCRVQHAAAVRRRRIAFGPPPRPPSPEREGDWITLEGILEAGDAREGPLASSRAGPPGMRRASRAGPMVLVAGRDRIALDAEIEVVVGSEERVPRDDDGRPDILALTREVCAGDRVLVRGVLRLASDRAPSSYRRNAIRWTLEGEGEPLRVAFDGHPRLRGTHRFFVAAMPSGWVAAAGAVAIVGATTLSGQGAEGPRPDPQPLEHGPPVAPGTLLSMSPEACEATATDEPDPRCPDEVREVVGVEGRCELK